MPVVLITGTFVAQDSIIASSAIAMIIVTERWTR